MIITAGRYNHEGNLDVQALEARCLCFTGSTSLGRDMLRDYCCGSRQNFVDSI